MSPGRRLALLAICVALALARMWLVSGRSVLAFPGNGFDDRLFADLALALLRGDWLGPYGEATLAKGPFYPLWIAGVYRAGVPLLMAQQVLYVLAAAVGVLALRPLLPTAWLAVSGFALLLCNPVGFAPGLTTRVIREGIYPALTLLVLGAAIGMLARRDRGPARLAPWAVGLALALTAFWLTREEGVWLVPGVALLLGWTVVGAFREGRAAAVAKVSLCLLPLAVCAFAAWGIRGVNDAHYGAPVATEMGSPAFESAYGALTRVTPARWSPVVPVPAETRARIYGASPAFGELRPFLEGDTGRRWAAHGCGAGLGCDDIGGAWFLWAFRQAAAQAGHFASGRASAAYFRRVAAEVNGACAAGRLACGPFRASLLPPWRTALAPRVLRSAARAAAALVRFHDPDPPLRPTYGSDAEQALFRRLARDAGGPPEKRLLIDARGVSPRGPVAVAVRTPAGAPAPAVVNRWPSPGRGADEPALDEADIRVETPCLAGCRLEVQAGGALLGVVPAAAGPALVTPDGAFQVAATRLTPARPPGEAWTDAVRRWVRRALEAIYRVTMPALAVLALAAYAAGSVQCLRARRLSPLWVIQSALLLALVARLAVLALIDATLFPATGIRYLAPAHPVLLLFVFVVAGDLARAWRARRAGRAAS